jgi:RNase H-fold protein (predicted Holliday junction resolvase)
VIYGLPLDQSGNSTPLCKKVEDFIKLLKKSHPHIIYIAEDERYTSQFAHMSMNEHDMGGEIDDIAASILLENYLSRNK